MHPWVGGAPGSPALLKPHEEHTFFDIGGCWQAHVRRPRIPHIAITTDAEAGSMATKETVDDGVNDPAEN